MLSGILHALREERLASGRTQDVLAVALPVRGRAISEWESETNGPCLNNLILWAAAMDRRLVIVDRGAVVCSDVRQLPNESWVRSERRRLANPLEKRRIDRGVTQLGLATRIGVSKATVQRWESVEVAPRSIALIVWALALECSLGLRVVDGLGEALRPQDDRQVSTVDANVRRDVEALPRGGA
jgi:transcriptional regulator with XRE-family HTH domain